MRFIFLRRHVLLRGAVLAGAVFLTGVLYVTGVAEQVAGVLARLDREVPIYAVDTKEKKVAISFDAAWGADYTPRLLEILRENKLKTTFFLTGIWVKKYPEMVKRIAAEGHELGNHSSTHPHCAALSQEEFKKELLENEEMIYQLTGKRTRLFRPPFGEYSNDVIKTARGLGYEVIQWSVDSLDWQEAGAEVMVDRVLNNIQPGAIVLFHNNARYTTEALPIIIKELQKLGYKILPISELLIKENYYIEKHSGIQKKRSP
ncbi:MAG: polysaccharide deacetylase family protein [Bacillota bacterium]|nr:polysaccharide deacetylase family protein [Bacillota bacterium]